MVATCLVGYAFSPIDLIPDFIPLVGYLDDLLLLPLGVALALRLVPRQVLRESRERAGDLVEQDKPVSRVAGVVVLLVWVALAGLAAWWGMRIFKR